MKIGIIGFGRLGKLITKYLAQDFDVFVYEKFPSTTFQDDLTLLNARSHSLREICSCDIVIPFVPISEFENCIKEISSLLKPGVLLADVCSVKEVPVEIMKKYLPEHVQILATHPMFGPDSAKDTVFGSKIVISNISTEITLYNKILAYFKTHGIKVIEATPKEHDKQIASSLVLSHLIGRVLIDLGSKQQEIDTKGYRRLLKILGTVENDSWQLFEDMNYYNKYAQELRVNFENSLSNVTGKLKN